MKSKTYLHLDPFIISAPADGLTSLAVISDSSISPYQRLKEVFNRLKLLPSTPENFEFVKLIG